MVQSLLRTFFPSCVDFVVLVTVLCIPGLYWVMSWVSGESIVKSPVVGVCVREPVVGRAAAECCVHVDVWLLLPHTGVYPLCSYRTKEVCAAVTLWSPLCWMRACRFAHDR